MEGRFGTQVAEAKGYYPRECVGGRREGEETSSTLESPLWHRDEHTSGKDVLAKQWGYLLQQDHILEL